jgi:hypothetical protein
LVGFVAVLALGCGGSKGLAPVSGKVTLDGVPLANAAVSFSPIAEKGSIDAGPGSVGKTNDKGEYTLEASTGSSGAQVGMHRVSITLLEGQAGDGDARAPRGGKQLVNKVPRKYSDPSELTFDVPSGGTNKADFPLTTK